MVIADIDEAQIEIEVAGPATLAERWAQYDKAVTRAAHLREQAARAEMAVTTLRIIIQDKTVDECLAVYRPTSPSLEPTADDVAQADGGDGPAPKVDVLVPPRPAAAAPAPAKRPTSSPRAAGGAGIHVDPDVAFADNRDFRRPSAERVTLATPGHRGTKDNADTIDGRILRALRDGPATGKDLSHNLGLTPKQVGNAMTRARAEGKVVKQPDNTWALRGTAS